MLILPQYNNIFGYFTAISLYQESRYNDTPIKRSNSTAPLTYRYIGVPLQFMYEQFDNLIKQPINIILLSMGTRLKNKQPVCCQAFFQFYFNVFVPELGQNSSLGCSGFFLVSVPKQILELRTHCSQGRVPMPPLPLMPWV